MWTYQPQLDGLRTVAVYLVLLYHAGVAAVGGGFVGVDVFFVLSGFLVSNVILSEIDRTGRLSISGFYARRIRRLLPAAIVVVIGTCVMYLLVAGYLQRLVIVEDARAALLYYANWHFLSQSNDYFAQTLQPSPFLHFWSLSIEEQFYLFFPVLIVLLSRSGPRWGRNLAVVLAGMFVLSLSAQIFWGVQDINHAYYGTDARLYQLFAGALLALALRHRAQLMSPGQATIAGGAGLVGLMLVASGLLEVSPSLRGIAATLCAVLLIGGTMVLPEGWLGRALAHRVPVYLGKISYGTYLWHWPVILILRQFLGLGPMVVAAISIVLVTGLAALSFKLVESPIRRAPRLRPYRRQVVAAGLALSALISVFVVPQLLTVTRYPVLLAGGRDFGPPVTSTEGREEVPESIDWQSIVEERGLVEDCPPDDVEECVVVQGSGAHLLLVGDSHAGMLAPMLETLAEEHDFTFSMNVVPGCGWMTGLVNVRVPESVQEDCYDAREGWYDEALPRLDPDAILLVQKARDDEEVWTKNLRYPDGSKGPLEEMLQDTSLDTLRELAAGGTEVLVAHTVMTPRPLRVQDCLASSRTVGECPVPFPTAYPPVDAAYETADKELANVWTVDLNRVVCPRGERCLGILDGELVWRDEDHLSEGFVHARREVFWAQLKGSGALSAFG